MGFGWGLSVCNWRSWFTIDIYTWSNLHLATQGFYDLICLLCSPCGGTVPLGPHVCLINLGNYVASSLCGTGDACGGQVGRSNLCPVTVCYVACCIVIPRRPWCPPPSSNFMVEAFTWVLRWILKMILYLMTPSDFWVFLKVFPANVLGFGSHYWFWFQRVWWSKLRMVSLSLCLVAFVLSKFG